MKSEKKSKKEKRSSKKSGKKHKKSRNGKPKAELCLRWKPPKKPLGEMIEGKSAYTSLCLALHFVLTALLEH